jgi:hypothetical protein
MALYMNETFRISEAALRMRRRTLASVPLFVSGVVAFQLYRSPKDVVVSIVMAGVIVGISVVVAIRHYKGFSKFAALHSLTVSDNFMLLRDGDIETRIPYSCIEQLTLTGTTNQATAVTLKCRGVPDQMLYGYEHFPRVTEMLLNKVPHAVVRTRGLFTYNKAFKRRRA